MAVIKVFSPSGVKTVVMLGNVSEQDYDPVDEEDLSASEDTEAEE